MKNLLLIFASFFLYSCSINMTKQQLLLPNTEIRFLTAKSNNITYKLFISTPPKYYQSNESYPVLYLLDPDIEFSLAHSLSHALTNFDTIKPFIIVGIGYQNQNLLTMTEEAFWKQWALNRTRDYIPLSLESGIKDFEGDNGEYKGLAKYSGGGIKFLNFIEKELIEYIDNSYRTSNERTLSGHSLGGFFATWVMLNYPLIFEKYLILSPSLWIEKSYIVQQFYKPNQEITISAYFAVGSLEKGDDYKMITNLEKFYSALPKSTNFRSKLDIIDDDNHVSMVASGMNKGFKFLFGK